MLADHPSSLLILRDGQEHDGKELFGLLSLQIFQTGLSWKTVWKKRDAFRAAFCDWDASQISEFTDSDLERLLEDRGIVRNRRKIAAVFHNAKIVAEMERSVRRRFRRNQAEGRNFSSSSAFLLFFYLCVDLVSQLPGSFSEYVWSLAPLNDEERLLHGTRLQENHMRDDFKTRSEDRTVSDGVHPTKVCSRVEKALKSIGFKHIGSTSALTFMQTTGLMNHHGRECFVFEVGWEGCPDLCLPDVGWCGELTSNFWAATSCETDRGSCTPSQIGATPDGGEGRGSPGTAEGVGRTHPSLAGGSQTLYPRTEEATRTLRRTQGERRGGGGERGGKDSSTATQETQDVNYWMVMNEGESAII